MDDFAMNVGAWAARIAPQVAYVGIPMLGALLQ